MGIRIEIAELDNGFIVNTFSMQGKSSEDCNKFFPTILEALAFAESWALRKILIGEVSKNKKGKKKKGENQQ